MTYLTQHACRRMEERGITATMVAAVLHSAEREPWSYDGKENLSLCGLTAGVKNESSGTIKDNGVSQSLDVKVGASTLETKRTKGSYKLAPYRTFLEVEQPASAFVFRLRESNGFQAGLFTADGGAWSLEAMENVGAWLRNALKNALVSDEPGVSVTVPVLV